MGWEFLFSRMLYSYIQAITGPYYRVGTFNNVPCWGKQPKDAEDTIFYVFACLEDGSLKGWWLSKTIDNDPEGDHSNLVGWAWERKDGNANYPLRLHIPYSQRCISNLVDVYEYNHYCHYYHYSTTNYSRTTTTNYSRTTTNY